GARSSATIAPQTSAARSRRRACSSTAATVSARPGLPSGISGGRGGCEEPAEALALPGFGVRPGALRRRSGAGCRGGALGLEVRVLLRRAPPREALRRRRSWGGAGRLAQWKPVRRGATRGRGPLARLEPRDLGARRPSERALACAR